MLSKVKLIIWYIILKNSILRRAESTKTYVSPGTAKQIYYEQKTTCFVDGNKARWMYASASQSGSEISLSAGITQAGARLRCNRLDGSAHAHYLRRAAAARTR